MAISRIYTDTILSTPGLVGYWKLDETSGSIAWSANGAVNGNRYGVISGGTPIWPEWNHDGTGEGYSVGFDGVNDYVDFGNTFGFINKDSFTLEAWVWPANGGPTGFPTFLSKMRYGTGYGGYEIYLDKANQRFVWARRGGNVTNFCYSAQWGIAYQTWYHVVARYDGSVNEMTMFVDGVWHSTTVSSSNMAANDWNFRFGCYSGGTDWYQGHLDEVAVYNWALSDAHIVRHYQRGTRNRFDVGSYAFIL